MIIVSTYICDRCGQEVNELLPMICDVCDFILCPECASAGCCDELMKEANNRKGGAVSARDCATWLVKAGPRHL